MRFDIAFIILLITYFPVVFIRKKRINMMYYVYIMITMSLVAYRSYVYPQFFGDSIRFNKILDMARMFGSWESGRQWILLNSEYSDQPLVAFYLSLFTVFKSNGWLRGITIFIFLFLIIKTILILKSKYSISYFSSNGVLITFLMCFNIGFEIQGIRNFLSFAFINLVSVILLIDWKPKRLLLVIILLLVSFGLHPSSIIPMVFLLLIFLLNGKFSGLIKFLALTSQLLLPYIVNFLGNFRNIPMIDVIVRKSDSYLNVGGSFEAFAGTKEIILTSLVLVMILMILASYFTLENRPISKIYVDYFITVLLICIGSFNSTQVYLRLVMLLLMGVFPFGMVAIDEFSKKCLLNEKMNPILIVCMLTIVVVSIVMLLGWSNFTYSRMGI